jgi:hypothetical protein
LDNQNEIEDLPTYEPPASRNNTSNLSTPDNSANEMDQSTLSVDQLDEVVDSFVESILHQITETSDHGDDTDVEVDDADYIIERLDQPISDCVINGHQEDE